MQAVLQGERAIVKGARCPSEFQPALCLRIQTNLMMFRSELLKALESFRNNHLGRVSSKLLVPWQILGAFF